MSTEEFPVLDSDGVVRGFPRLEAGNVLKVTADSFTNDFDLADLVLGSAVIIHVPDIEGTDVSLLLRDDADSVELEEDQVAATVTTVHDDVMTLEIVDTPHSGDEE